MQISDLSDREEWLDTIASWHHIEWLKGRISATEASSHSSLTKRVRVLRGHLGCEPIPSTFVAELNGKPIGSASVVFYRFTQKQRQSEWLTNVYVCPEYRNQGIGKALIERICQHAAANKVKELRLYTLDKRNFYAGLGWKDIGTGIVQKNEVAILAKQIVGRCKVTHISESGIRRQVQKGVA